MHDEFHVRSEVESEVGEVVQSWSGEDVSVKK